MRSNRAVGKSKSVTDGHWNNIENHRIFMDKVADCLQISDVDDWYSAKYRDVVNRFGGKSMLENFYEYSVSKCLLSVYKDTHWQLWRFASVNEIFWRNFQNHVEFFQWIGDKLNIDRMDDWYSLTLEDISKYGGFWLMRNHYDGFIYNALILIYPEYNFLPWKFKVLPNNFWSDESNRYRFMEHLARSLNKEHQDYQEDELNISEEKEEEKWSKLTLEDFNKNGGRSMVDHYYFNSPLQCLMSLYPLIHWKPWKFQSVPRNYWDNPKHSRDYADWLADILNIHAVEDWYGIKLEDFRINHGTGMMISCYDNSPFKVIYFIPPNE
jgi:hypothetical protein